VGLYGILVLIFSHKIEVSKDFDLNILLNRPIFHIVKHNIFFFIKKSFFFSYILKDGSYGIDYISKISTRANSHYYDKDFFEIINWDNVTVSDSNHGYN
jgi:hypothetical protein